jgi:ABC-type oligopeptide transport system substrate-binding subunit
LALAIDRDLLTEKIAQFGELPSYTLVPPGIRDYVSPLPEWAEWTQEERNTEARRLYAESGYSEDNPLKFEIRYDTGESNKKIALAVSSLWKQVLGVQATLITEEFGVFLRNREQKVLTQVFRAGWISDYADAYSFLNLFRTGHGNNDYGYSNSLYDSLLDEVAGERIPSRRRRLMFETERMLLAETPFVPVYTYVTKRMVNPLLKGWQSNVMDHHYSKDMFFLREASDEPADVVIEEAITTESVDEAATPVEGDETEITEETAETAVPPEEEIVVPREMEELLVPEEAATAASEKDSPDKDASGNDDGTNPEDPVE